MFKPRRSKRPSRSPKQHRPVKHASKPSVITHIARPMTSSPMDDPKNFETVARTVIRSQPHHQERDISPATLKRQQLSAAVKYVPSDLESDPEFIRKASSMDFNLDFDLELKWQQHLEQYNTQIDRKGDVDQTVEKEHEALLAELAEVRRRELEYEAKHLEYIRDQKQRLKQLTQPSKPDSKMSDYEGAAYVPFDDDNESDQTPDIMRDYAPMKSRSILTKIEFTMDPDREKHIDNIIDGIMAKYNRHEKVLTPIHRRKMKEMLLLPRTKNVKVVQDPITGGIELIPVLGKELTKIQRTIKEQIDTMDEHQKERQRVGDDILKVKEIFKKHGDTNPSLNILHGKGRIGLSQLPDGSIHDGNDDDDENVDIRSPLHVKMPSIDDPAFSIIDEIDQEEKREEMIHDIRRRYPSYNTQYTGHDFKQALERYYATPGLEEIGHSPNDIPNLGHKIHFNQIDIEGSKDSLDDDSVAQAYSKYGDIHLPGMNYDKDAEKIFKTPEHAKRDELQQEDIALGRQQALEMKQSGFKGDLSQFLHPSDRDFFDPVTNQVYTSRAAKRTAESTRPTDDNGPLYLLEDQATEFVDLLFQQGRRRGGIGPSPEADDDDDDDDGNDHQTGKSTQASSSHSDEQDGSTKEPDKGQFKLKTRFHTRKGLAKDSLEAHPIEHLTKFLMRVHPDLFVQDVYNVMDDISTLTLNRVSKIKRDKYGREIQTQIQADPEPTESYLSGEFSAPHNIRYYQLSNNIIQLHNTEEVSKLNVLIDYYKKIVALTPQEQADPFAPHLGENVAPKKVKMVFFLRPKRGTPFAKPSNLIPTNPIWDDQGNELKPSDIQLLDDVPFDQAEHIPHLRVVRILFNPPRPVTDTYQNSINLITSLERTFVEILRGIDDDIPVSLLEKWKTDLQIILDAKIWSGNERREKTLIDKVFRVSKKDLLNPNLEEDFAQSQYNFMHLFPNANPMTEAEHRLETHPRYHLFNALLAGGYVTFHPDVSKREKIQSTQRMKAMLAEGYSFFDCEKWWSRRMTEMEVMKRRNLAKYVGQQSDEIDHDGSLLKHNLGDDEDAKQIWPSTQQGEGVRLHFAFHITSAGTPPTAMIVSSSHIMNQAYKNSSHHLDVLTKLFNAERIQALEQEDDGDVDDLISLFDNDTHVPDEGDILTAKAYHQGIFGVDYTGDSPHDEFDHNSDGDVDDHSYKSSLHVQPLASSRSIEKTIRPSISLKFPSTYADYCLLITIPSDIKPEQLQDFLFSHAYILKSEWEYHIRNYHQEFNQLSQAYVQNEGKSGRYNPLPLEKALVIGKAPQSLAVVQKYQPMLYDLLRFYSSMQKLKYTQQQQQQKQQQQQQQQNQQQANTEPRKSPSRNDASSPRSSNTAQPQTQQPVQTRTVQQPDIEEHPKLKALTGALAHYNELLRQDPGNPKLRVRSQQIRRARELLVSSLLSEQPPPEPLLVTPRMAAPPPEQSRNHKTHPEGNRRKRREAMERQTSPEDQIIQSFRDQQHKNKVNNLQSDMSHILLEQVIRKARAKKRADPNNMNHLLEQHHQEIYGRSKTPSSRGSYLKRLNEVSAPYEMRPDKM